MATEHEIELLRQIEGAVWILMDRRAKDQSDFTKWYADYEDATCDLFALTAVLLRVRTENDRNGQRCVVYRLFDKADGVTRYIGQTDQDPERRFKQHIGDSKRRGNEKDEWVADTAATGRLGMQVVLDPATRDVDELQAIRWARALGLPLLNSIPFPAVIPGPSFSHAAPIEAAAE